MSSKDRKLIKKVLRKKFDEDSSNKLEEELYLMCLELSKLEDEEVEDVYKKQSYQKVGDLFFVETDEGILDICQDFKNCIISWDSSVYKEFRTRKEINNSTTGIKVQEGEFLCRNKECRSKKCLYYSTQDRGADEPMTINIICSKCWTRTKF